MSQPVSQRGRLVVGKNPCGDDRTVSRQVIAALACCLDGRRNCVGSHLGRQPLAAILVRVDAAELRALRRAVAWRAGPEPPVVLIAHEVSDAIHELLGPVCELQINRSATPWHAEHLSELVGNASALLAFMTERVDERLLRAAPKLRIVAGAFKGADNVDVEACTSRGVWVTACDELLTEPTADLAICLMLALARRLLEGDALIREGDFDGWRPRLYGVDLREKTLGIIGLGAVGLAVARRARAFSLNVVYADPRPAPAQLAKDLALQRLSLPALLGRCHVCLPLLPLNDATRNLVDAAALEQMPPGGLLINVGRGSVVDESAVASALASGRLGGYAADVFALEDLSLPDRPRQIHPALRGDCVRTVMSPHIGSAVGNVRREIEIEAAVNILHALAGRPPPGAVNEL